MENDLDQKIKQLKSELTKAGISPILDETDYLAKFLRARSLDVVQTVTLMKNYHDYKAINPRMFNLPFRLKPAFDANTIRLTTNRSISGEALILLKPGNWNPSLFDFDSNLSASLITLELAALDVQNQQTGVRLISDMDAFGWQQLKHFSPSQAKKLTHILEKVAPVKVNAIDVYNESKFALMAWTIIKSFLSAHLRNRVAFHGKDYKHLEGLVQNFQSLPNSLGGQGGSLESAETYLNLANCEQLFKSFGYS